MKIQSNHTEFIPFKSRNKIIRYADDIVRRVNVCYPRISSSKVDDFTNIHAFRKYHKELSDRVRMFREDIKDSFNEAVNLVGEAKAFVNPVKRHKLGNCGESAQLANILAKVNGIKNCYIASLRTSTLRSLDHSVVYVEGKTPYIIDAWLGFADYVPNAILRYKNEYRKHFFILDDNKLIFQKLDNKYTHSLNQNFTQIQIDELKKIFPEQVIKKGQM